MNLVIDIGNTRTKLAVINDKEIIFNTIMNGFRLENLHQVVVDHPALSKAILSSVKEYPEEVKKYLSKSFRHFIELDHHTLIPLKNHYKTPETLGKDRLAAAVGANQLFPDKNILVIDAGTAITFDLISENNEYMGGNISPGLNTRFKALQHFTGKLPLVCPDKTFPEIGTDTESAIRAGVQLGIVFEVKQYIRHFNNLYQNLQIIITGGDAKFFDKKLKKTIFVNFNLTLFGLNRILEYNVEET